MRASVVICTLNRSPVLKACLKGIEAQTDIAPSEVEIVIIDNGSTDDTPTVAKDFRRYARYPVRWCVEERIGVVHARNRGVAEAHGDLVAFLDDDAVPDPRWLATLIACADETDADAVGGRIVLDWDAPRPRWLHPVLDAFLGEIDCGDARRPFEFPACYPGAANLAIRRSVLESVGAFDPSFGFQRGEVVGAEETDLCYRIERAGGMLLYEPGALVHHPVAAGKLTKHHFRRRAWQAGRSACRIEAKHQGRAKLFRSNLNRLGKRRASNEPSPPAEKPPLAARLFLARFRLLFTLGYLNQLLKPR